MLLGTIRYSSSKREGAAWLPSHCLSPRNVGEGERWAGAAHQPELRAGVVALHGLPRAAAREALFHSYFTSVGLKSCLRLGLYNAK